MRKAWLCALMTALVVSSLAACSGKASPQEALQEIQNGFSSSQQLSLSAAVTADYGQRVYDFYLEYQQEGENGIITIREPESISGTIVEIDGGVSQLVFDGASVYTGEILPDGLSPVDCMPIMTSSWSQSTADQVFYENWNGTQCLLAISTVDDDTYLSTWFDVSSCLPLHSEISYQGYTVIFCDFDNIVLQ